MTLFFIIAALVPALVFSSEIFVVEMRGTINPASAHFLERSIEKAQKARAHFLLIELDTPGGLATSVRQMAQSIDQAHLPVLVYTTPAGAAATSAGAILMLSAHLSAMAPGTNIGAAHPVSLEGADIKGVMDEKAVNDIAAFARSLALLRKKNVTAASEVVTKSNSYTAEEALAVNLIDIVASDREALFKEINNKELQVGPKKIILKTSPVPSLVFVKMTLGESILNSLSHPNIAAILMTLAIVFIFAEFQAPGIGMAGIAGGLCLIISFIAFQAIPIQTGGLLLIAIGALLILSEVFFTSGALALGGTASLMLGLLWVVDPNATDLRISPWIVAITGVILLSGTGLILYGMAVTRKQSEATLKRIGGGGVAGLAGYKGRILDLSPDGRSGQVLIRGERWKFITDEKKLNVNDKVTVIRTSGLTLEVIRDKESEHGKF